MTWEDNLNEKEIMLKQLFIAIGSAGHGKLTIVFNKGNNRIDITPEPTFRDTQEFENYKAVLK